MLPLTREAARTSIVNLDPGAGRVRLPVWFDDVDWARQDYVAWRDLRSPDHAYLITEVDDEPRGVLLRQNPVQAGLAWRAVICDLCRSARRHNDVVFFTARRPSKDKRQRLSTLGLYLCAEFECAAPPRARPGWAHTGAADDDALAARREGLRERTRAFVRSVAVDPATRGRGR